MLKKVSRIRRTKKTRATIKRLSVPRLCVHRSLQHIYVQLIAANGSETLASVSTLDSEVKATPASGGKKGSAAIVGKLVAQRVLALGISSVAFDRSGFKYHGRIKALADAAREAGLIF